MSPSLTLLSGFVQNALLASIPAVGFALLFQVPSSALAYCAAGGALGRGLRFLLMETAIHMPIEWATLIAASVVSMAGVLVARRIRSHPKVFTVAAMIPMIPGVPFFTTLEALAQIQKSGFSNDLLATVVTYGLRTAFIVSALSIGLAMPGLLFYRRRPIV